MPDIRSFESLEVWQKTHELMLFVHREVVPRLPPEEKWDLTLQIRKSAKSSDANIAEGHGRFYFQDNVRFCYNARGSLDETISHLITARDLGYIPLDIYGQGRQLADAAARLMNGYIAYLKRRKVGIDEPGAAIHPGELLPPDASP